MKLGDLQKEIMSLESEIRNLEKIIEKSKTESIHLQKQHQGEIYKNRDLANKSNSLESSIQLIILFQYFKN